MQSPAPDPNRGFRAPAQIGPYAIERELGRGGMGVALLARDGQTARLVVLKIALAAPPGSDERERFERESAFLRRVKHPGVVGVIDSFEHAGRPVIVMQYVPGRSLAELIEESFRLTGEMPDGLWLEEIMTQLSGALAACHAAGVIHRDVKPENIVVEAESGRAVLVDFGIAKVDPASSGETVEQLTLSGQLVGTPAYMAPEQLDSTTFGPVGPAADIWALGTVLFQALTGELPFEARGAVDYFIAVTTGRPRRPSQIAPKAPLRLEQVCIRCLRSQPGQRPSAAELERALGDPSLGSLGEGRAVLSFVPHFLGLLIILWVGLGTAWFLRPRPPRLALAGGLGERLQREAIITLRGYVKGSGPFRVKAGAKSKTLARPGPFRIQLPLQPGANKFTLQASDSSGRVSESLAIVVRRDNKAPSLLFDPLPKKLEGPLVITGLVSEAGCRLSVEGGDGELNGRQLSLSPKPGQRCRLTLTDRVGLRRRFDAPALFIAPEPPGELDDLIRSAPGSKRIYLSTGVHHLRGPVTRPVELVGGSAGVCLLGPARSIIVVQAPLLLRNLELRSAGETQRPPALAAQKALPKTLLQITAACRIEDCRLWSQRDAIIRLQGKPRPPSKEPTRLLVIRRSWLRVFGREGINMRNAGALIEGSTLSGSNLGNASLINVDAEAQLLLRNCVLRDSPSKLILSRLGLVDAEHCQFSRALYGIRAWHSSLRLLDCLFTENQKGAIRCLDAGHVTASSCEFVRCGWQGLPMIAAVHAAYSRIVLKRCRWRNNYGAHISAAGAATVLVREPRWSGDLKTRLIATEGALILPSQGQGD